MLNRSARDHDVPLGSGSPDSAIGDDFPWPFPNKRAMWSVRSCCRRAVALVSRHRGEDVGPDYIPRVSLLETAVSDFATLLLPEVVQYKTFRTTTAGLARYETLREAATGWQRTGIAFLHIEHTDRRVDAVARRIK